MANIDPQGKTPTQPAAPQISRPLNQELLTSHSNMRPALDSIEEMLDSPVLINWVRTFLEKIMHFGVDLCCYPLANANQYLMMGLGSLGCPHAELWNNNRVRKHLSAESGLL